MINICSVGGYNEVGKNMVAVNTPDGGVIFDMGFHMQRIIQLDAVPDDNVISSWAPNIKAITLSHCHLDHIGAVPYMSPTYNAPIYGTPFTMTVLERMLKDETLSIPNSLHHLQTGNIVKINNNRSCELIHVTHSPPHSAFIALHTKDGVILYATD